MGSWNGTCALTNLPIHDGEPVVMFVITTHGVGYRRDFGGGTIEPYTNASPLGPLLHGTYNGYGGVTGLSGPALPWWTEHLRELRGSLLDEYGEALQFDSIDEFINNGHYGVERGGVYVGVPEHAEGNSRLALMLVHAEAYSQFMAAGIDSEDWMFDDPCENAVTHYLLDLQERTKQVASLEPGQALPRKLFREGYRMFDGLESVIRYAANTGAEDILKEVAALRIFDLLLGCARKSWDRQCGAGSGNSDASLQVTLARFTLQYTDTK